MQAKAVLDVTYFCLGQLQATPKHIIQATGDEPRSCVRSHGDFVYPFHGVTEAGHQVPASSGLHGGGQVGARLRNGEEFRFCLLEARPP